jgi:hypothetical protein
MTDKNKMASPFRFFCNEKWFEHKDEIFAWTGRPVTEYDSTYYFRKHRWLLKQMYQEQQIENYRIENEKTIQKEIKRGFKKGNL